LAQRFSATDLAVKRVREGWEVKIYLGSILRGGFRPRSGRELRIVMDELKRVAEARGFAVAELGVVEEAVNLEGVDPSVVAQALRHNPTKVSYKWQV
jgi:hypothetical protein